MSDAENQGYLIGFQETDTGMKIDSWADRLGDVGCEMAIWAPDALVAEDQPCIPGRHSA